MPLIRFDTVEGALDKAQKAKLSKALTSVVEEIVGPEMKGHTWVVINEAPEGNFFVGGQSLQSQVYHQIMEKNGNRE